MSERTQEEIDRLKRFCKKTGAGIDTFDMSQTDWLDLAALLDRWENGERELETVIRARFVIELDDGALS